MNKQRGFTFFTLVLTIAAIVFVAVLAMKLWPSYNEYFTIKRAFGTLRTEVSNSDVSKADIVKSFDKQAQIDDIKSIRGSDLIVEKTGAGTVVSVEYQVVTPLFANISVLVDFFVSTDETATAESVNAAAALPNEPAEVAEPATE